MTLVDMYDCITSNATVACKMYSKYIRQYYNVFSIECIHVIQLYIIILGAISAYNNTCLHVCLYHMCVCITFVFVSYVCLYYICVCITCVFLSEIMCVCITCVFVLHVCLYHMNSYRYVN